MIFVQTLNSFLHPFSIENVEKIYYYGLSPLPTQNISIPGEEEDEWNLITFNDILRLSKSEKINTVIFDLEGGEWDVFMAILKTNELQTFVQKIEMRMRLVN